LLLVSLTAIQARKTQPGAGHSKKAYSHPDVKLDSDDDVEEIRPEAVALIKQKMQARMVPGPLVNFDLRAAGDGEVSPPDTIGGRVRAGTYMIFNALC
jgi:hypothetical protein